MTGLDLLIVALVLVLTLRGIWRGFINDLSGLLGLLLGYLFAGPLAKRVEPFLEAFLEGPSLREGVAYY
ncbi:MAG: CvpA family protein, partial [Schleiferiaceae bacterium]|nr:CvpA family protein [Schleiferiaceae bacterium]